MQCGLVAPLRRGALFGAPATKAPTGRPGLIVEARMRRNPTPVVGGSGRLQCACPESPSITKILRGLAGDIPGSLAYRQLLEGGAVQGHRRLHAADFHLVPGPVVAVARSFFERFAVGPVQNHRFLVFEIENRLLLLVLSLSNKLHGHVRDRCNDRCGLGILEFL
jgi:hypothetical protein